MKKPRILAVASAGGHWVQLLRIRDAFADGDVTWVSTNRHLGDFVNPDRFETVRDSSKSDPIALILCFLQILWVVLRVRPRVVVSTGAAPGFFAILVGRLLFRANTIWIDSVANADELSLSGKKARRWTVHWLTQWPELASAEGPHYLGSVL